MVRFFVFLLITLSVSAQGYSQNFSGQWKGTFLDKSNRNAVWGGDKTEYVVDLEFQGKSVTGYSYTYFTDGVRRYYTICKLAGTYDAKRRSVEFTEIERTKTNVPVEIKNCFQVHKLTYFKTNEGEETLEGSWVPAPNQAPCGFGTTVLSRRLLKNTIAGYKGPATSNPRNYSESVAQSKPKPVTKSSAGKPADPTTKPADSQAGITRRLQENNSPIISAPGEIPAPHHIFEKRSSNLLRTIEIESNDVRIDLYDNGEVDGDSVSLFLNDKLIMTGKKLSAQPLTLHLRKEDLKADNELVMYAENLGAIPPNTALMIVTDGTKRYEVRITSDLQKSGTIRFLKKQ